jgi:hypothetical protein
MFDPTDKTFDKHAKEFTEIVMRAAAWKEVYYGAAYSTRIKQAVEDLKKAITLAEDHLINK